jgi:hypothetical protein
MPDLCFLEVFSVGSKLLELLRVVFAGSDENFHDFVDFLEFHKFGLLLIEDFVEICHYTLS